MREYTQEELLFISTFESNIASSHPEKPSLGWIDLRGVNNDDLDKLYKIHVDATGYNERLNRNCGVCVISLFQAIGRKYYAEKDNVVTKVTRRRRNGKAK